MNNQESEKDCITTFAFQFAIIFGLVFVITVALCTVLALKVIPNTVERSFYKKYINLLPAYKIYLEERISGRSDIELSRLSRFITDSETGSYIREGTANSS